ncbi:MAG: hypothetical protein AMXMBFR33_00810 [Candidatus Xenobia bacterium]|jgi:CHAT domain-containing protein
MRKVVLCLSLTLVLLAPGWAQATWDEMEAKHSPLEVSEMLTSLAFISLRLGSFQAADQLIAVNEKRLARTGVPEGWDLLRGELALAPLIEALGQGRFDRVLTDAPRAIQRARKAGRADRELSLTLILLQAARTSGRPGVLQEHLPRALELARANSTATGRVTLFLIETMEAERRFRLKLPSSAELNAAHEQAWSSMRGLVVDPDFLRNSLIEARVLPEAVLFWWQNALAVNGLESAISWFEPDLDQLQKTFLYEQPDKPPVEFLRELNLQGPVAVMESGMNGLELLSRASPEAGPEVRKQYYLLAGQIDGMYDELSTMENGLKKNLPLLSEFTFLKGDLAFIKGRVHQLIVRQLVQELENGQADPEQLAEIQRQMAVASQAMEYSENRALRLELDFDRLSTLTTTRPQGWLEQAQLLLQRMLPSLESIGYRPGLVRALTLKGRLLADQKRTPEAIATLEKAVGLVESYIVEVGGGPETAQRLRGDARDLYELLTRLQLESGRGEEAADTLDRYRQLNSASQFGMQDLTPRSKETEALVLRATEAQTRFQATEAASLNYSNSGVSRLADTKQDYYRVLQEIQDQDQAYGRLQVRPKTFSKVQKSLPEGTLLVQLFPSENHLYLFVATREALKVRRVDVKGEELTNLVSQFRQQISAFSRSADGETPFKLEDDPILTACLKSLSSSFLDPLAEDLKGKKVVAFVPTGTLSYFPFQALPYGQGYLIQSMEVVTLVKASDLDQLHQAPGEGGGSLLALGDPDGSLKAARQELVSLQELFPESKVWVGPEATSERLQSLSPGTGYVHLATHGILNTRDPLQSYLLVAATSKSSDRLTVSEIAGLDLEGVRVVTLSACSTALAEKSPGVGTELASLADAFSYAGSPTLVASLWKVADQPTRELMLTFYQGLKAGQGRGQALRQAQVSLLEQPRYAHPFYWAPFTLMGDWR